MTRLESQRGRWDPCPGLSTHRPASSAARACLRCTFRRRFAETFRPPNLAHADAVMIDHTSEAIGAILFDDSPHLMRGLRQIC